MVSINRSCCAGNTPMTADAPLGIKQLIPLLEAAAKLPGKGPLATVAMLVAVSCIVASEIAWRSLLKKSAGPLGGRVQIAFIIRLALREGAGLLGMVVAYLAALNGVLRVYPAYWVNGAPFALFLGFLAAHWPSAETLAVEAREILGS